MELEPDAGGQVEERIAPSIGQCCAHAMRGSCFGNGVYRPILIPKETSLSSWNPRLIAEPQLLEEIAKKGNMAARRFQTHAIANKLLKDFESLLASL